MDAMPNNIQDLLYRHREEAYLEYKEDINWKNDRDKQLEVMKTVFAMANEQDGGTIIIGVDKHGNRVGMRDANYVSFTHDTFNQKIAGKTNQPIQCRVSQFEHKDLEDGKHKKFVIIQISEVKEFPVVYIARTEVINQSKPPLPNNIGLRQSALYIRNKLAVGNKEIETMQEWESIIERTYRKYERESLRRLSKVIVTQGGENPYDKEVQL